MHSATVLGYTYQGAAYCADHKPTLADGDHPDEIGVIFADADNVWDMTCDVDHEPLDDMPAPLPGYVDTMVTHYLIAALWSSNDGDDFLDASYDLDDISDETRTQAEEDCESFARSTFGWLYRDGWSAEQAGHDFWLTRNGHGAGFWDRGKDSGDLLTRMAHPYGSVDLYVGNDGLVYGS